jgi:amidase
VTAIQGPSTLEPAAVAFLSASEQAQLVKRREVSPLELVELYLERIGRLNPVLNAFVTLLADESLATARRYTDMLKGSEELPLFHGIPIPIKELNPVKGVLTTFSHKGFSTYVPTEDPAMVRRLREAGFILQGKTNAPEFGTIGTTESDQNGICRNPWDLSRSASGSSGGSAAAVTAGLSPVAQGSDGGGSIRLPASFCGLFGLKPARGRISRAPAGAVMQGMPTDGPLSRTVQDAAALLDVMAGPELGDPYWAAPPEQGFAGALRTPVGRLRIGVTMTGPWNASVDAECATAVRDAAKLLADLGHEVEEASPVWTDPALQGHVRTLFGSAPGAWMKTDVALMEPHNRYLVRLGEATSSLDLVRTIVAVHAFSRRVIAATHRYDAVLMPSSPFQPFPHGWVTESEPWDLGSRHFEYIAFTIIANLTGQPAMSVPLHWTPAGLPVGVQFVGRPEDERTLLQLAHQLEEAHPWQGRRPPIAA